MPPVAKNTKNAMTTAAPKSVKGKVATSAPAKAATAAKAAPKPAASKPAPPAEEPKKDAVAAPAPAEATAEAPVEAPVNPWDAVLEKFDAYDATIAGMIESLRALQKEIKAHKKTVKTTSVATSKRKRAAPAGGNPVPSGFRKPTKISAEMREFLNTTKDLVTRNEVTNGVMEYIRDNNLGRGKNFAPDETLRALLLEEDRSKEEIPYFGLQRFIKHHFIKDE